MPKFDNMDLKVNIPERKVYFLNHYVFILRDGENTQAGGGAEGEKRVSSRLLG